MVKPEASACWVFTVTPALTVSLSTAPSRPELYTLILVSVGERSVPQFNTSLRKWWSFPSGKGEENSAPGVSLPGRHVALCSGSWRILLQSQK